MTFLQACALFLAAFLAGALNAVAGGGSFITLPALIFTGVGPTLANTTSNIALWPGTLASVGAYRKDLGRYDRVLTSLLIGVSIVGGALGAFILLKTPTVVFQRLIPYLLLAATLLFAFSGSITRALHRFAQRPHDAPATNADESADQPVRFTRRALALVAVAQFAVAIYGGFYGGGASIVMLAILGVLGLTNIHSMNALKAVLSSCVNGIAVLAFIATGNVLWPQAILMIFGSVVGSYGAASFARRIAPRYVRRFVILVGATMTLYFFLFGGSPPATHKHLPHTALAPLCLTDLSALCAHPPAAR